MDEKILYAFLMVFILLGVGTMYFHKTERWSYVDSFYFSTMTLTTIGYGDLVPTQESTKIFTSFYAILGMGVMFYLVIVIIGGYIKFKQKKYFDKIISKLHKLGLVFKSAKKK